MNSPHVRGYAEAFARRVDEAAETPEGAVQTAFRMALGRKPTKEELSENAAFIRDQASSYGKEGRKDFRAAALADFCQILFSLNEFAYAF